MTCYLVALMRHKKEPLNGFTMTHGRDNLLLIHPICYFSGLNWYQEQPTYLVDLYDLCVW